MRGQVVIGVGSFSTFDVNSVQAGCAAGAQLSPLCSHRHRGSACQRTASRSISVDWESLKLSSVTITIERLPFATAFFGPRREHAQPTDGCCDPCASEQSCWHGNCHTVDHDVLLRQGTDLQRSRCLVYGLNSGGGQRQGCCGCNNHAGRPTGHDNAPCTDGRTRRSSPTLIRNAFRSTGSNCPNAKRPRSRCETG